MPAVSVLAKLQQLIVAVRNHEDGRIRRQFAVNDLADSAD
jgi:hypothetical protein